MSTNPTVLSSINVNADLEKAIRGAVSTEDLKAAILKEAEVQGQAAAQVAQAAQDVKDKEAAAAKAAADAPQTFERTITIGGKNFTFQDESELGLERQVNNALTVAYNLRESTEMRNEPAVDAAAIAANEQKAADLRAAELADLETKFKRGDISTAEYLEKSGAVEDYLGKHGLSTKALKEVVEDREVTKEEQSWAQATEVFRNSAAGADWPGGAQNLQIIGMELTAHPELLDAEDKVAALAQAYQYMKEKNLVFPNTAAASTLTQAEIDKKAADEKTAADAKAAADREAQRVLAASVAFARPEVPARTSSNASSLFGQSSGTGAQPVQTVAPGTAVSVGPNASPAEIMEAWKQSVAATGKHPDAAFMETFHR